MEAAFATALSAYSPSRRRLAFGLAAAPFVLAANRVSAEGEIVLSGQLRQGGFVFGRTRPHAAYAIDGKPQGRASAEGLFVVGLDRDAPPRAVVAIDEGSGWQSRTLDIAPVAYDIQHVDGLPPETVTPRPAPT